MVYLLYCLLLEDLLYIPCSTGSCECYPAVLIHHVYLTGMFFMSILIKCLGNNKKESWDVFFTLQIFFNFFWNVMRLLKIQTGGSDFSERDLSLQKAGFFYLVFEWDLFGPLTIIMRVGQLIWLARMSQKTFQFAWT